jgi:NitT/TauT family transport system substrate-binding protein
MKAHPEAVAVITEEFLKLWREMSANPGIIAQERAKFGLVADQPKLTAEEITASVKRSLDAKVWNPEGGSEQIARGDLDFYAEGGAFTVPASQLKIEDFWDLEPLKAAKKKLGA